MTCSIAIGRPVRLGEAVTVTDAKFNVINHIRMPSTARPISLAFREVLGGTQRHANTTNNNSHTTCSNSEQ